MNNCESCLMLKEAFLNIPDELKKALANPTYCRKCYQSELAKNKRLPEALEKINKKEGDCKNGVQMQRPMIFMI